MEIAASKGVTFFGGPDWTARTSGRLGTRFGAGGSSPRRIHKIHAHGNEDFFSPNKKREGRSRRRTMVLNLTETQAGPPKAAGTLSIR